MRRMRGALVVLALAVLGAVAAPAVAADDTAGLDVESVTGREVELRMTFDPQAPITADSEISSTVRVGGTVLPAESRLVVDDTTPTTAILVLDASGSMDGSRIAAAQKAATSFVAALPPDVRVGLVTFNEEIEVVAPPTADRAVIVDGIASVRPEGDTALYDAVRLALGQVPEGERARLVVLSDGQDTSSTSTLARLTKAVEARGIPIDVVALKPSTEQVEFLRRLSGVNGGTLLSAASSEDLQAAFTEASRQFGAKAYLTTTIPPSIDASGAPVLATVTIDGQVVRQATALPVTASLAAVPLTAPATLGAGPPTAAVASGGVDWAPILIAVLVGVAVLGAAFAIMLVRRDLTKRRRIEQVLRYDGRGARGTRADGETGPRWLNGLDRFLAEGEGYRKTAGRLAAAGWSLTPAGWLVIRLAVTLLLMIVLAALFRSPLIGAIAGILIGWLATHAWLRSRCTARQRAFASELPDFLMLLASGLRAGLSFTHALDSAASEGKGEVGRQMRRALREVQVGALLDAALMDCAERMDNDDLRWTVTALSIQREVGGNLSTILDNASATIKERYALRREVQTLSAEGRLSAYILLSLPLGVLLFLVVFRREYVSLLWTEPLGMVMLAVLIFLMISGWLWMRAIVRIKV